MSGSGRLRAIRPLDESTARQADEAQATREASSASTGLPLQPSSSSSSTAHSRSQNRTLSACLRCRRSKAKCTGARPRCRRCSDNDVPCEYDADPDITPALTLKRRNLELLRENQDLRDLVAFLTQKPRHETEDVFSRLRGGHDPVQVFGLLRAAGRSGTFVGVAVATTWDGLARQESVAVSDGTRSPDDVQQEKHVSERGPTTRRPTERLDIASLLS